ncbi:unnamed protein product [Moneuplotes crassus]|uniref:DNA mismatch repair proteins mutS family domain-containing protein n=1 Tax=Euplotes crassus TaxID=5936 RepID=A0AAD1YA29_EUPCR|nr:unnamed protein product [Moneuplotes crassus]
MPKDLVEETEVNNTFLCVNFELTGPDKIVGACFVNTDTRCIQLTEFIDNDHFSNLESLIIQMNNSSRRDCRFEILVNMPNDKVFKQRIEDIIQLCEVHFVVGNRKDFNEAELEQMLETLAKDKGSLLFIEESSLKCALPACKAAIEFCNLLSARSNHQQFDIMKYTLENYLRLDIAAMKALNLFPMDGAEIKGNIDRRNDSLSIFNLLNKTKTSIGQRLLKKWLKQPIRDIEEINRRLDIVEFFVDNDSHRTAIQTENFHNFPDIDKLFAKFYKVKNNKRNNASLADCVKCYNLILSLEQLLEFLTGLEVEESNEISKCYISPLQTSLKEFEKLKEMIEESVDISQMKQGEYIINPEFSEELKNLNELINDTYQKIENLRAKIQEELTLRRISIQENTVHGFLFEVDKREGDNALRKTNLTHNIVSTKNKIMTFTCPELKILVNEFNELQSQYKMQQDVLVDRVLSIVSTYYPVLEKVANIVAELDVLVSFATASTNTSNAYVRPIIGEEEGEFILEDSRHPLIEAMNSSTCISNDCKMKKNESHMLIITGPNMGGKSTYIRQVAINALLAHVGCFIPCSKAVIPKLDSIIARVGAADHQMKGISTFMAEMLEASCMLKTATKNSLIIMDELGRGTSTDEGFGLAWAIAEYLANTIKCYTLFATHFHEMTKMEKEVPSVKNLYVSALAEGDKLTMLYQIKEGVIDRSYGIHVAEMLKFDPQILNEAKAIANMLETFDNEDIEKQTEDTEMEKV